MKRSWFWISLNAALVVAFAFAGGAPAARADEAAAPAAKAAAAPSGAADKEVAHAQLADAQGKNVGSVQIRETPNGVILHARFTGLPPGEHAFHVHAVGKCEPPFDSAGPHFNPGNDKHGFAVEGGPHAGDLPNVVIPSDGKLEIDLFANDLTVSDGEDKMLDSDGAALIVHEKLDDYTSQPSGNAGSRIACGVVTAGPMTGAQ